MLRVLSDALEHVDHGDVYPGTYLAVWSCHKKTDGTFSEPSSSFLDDLSHPARQRERVATAHGQFNWVDDFPETRTISRFMAHGDPVRDGDRGKSTGCAAGAYTALLLTRQGDITGRPRSSRSRRRPRVARFPFPLTPREIAGAAPVRGRLWYAGALFLLNLRLAFRQLVVARFAAPDPLAVSLSVWLGRTIVLSARPA